MQINVRIDEGNWGNSIPGNIAKVAESVAAAFPAMADSPRIGITLRPSQKEHPETLRQLNEQGDFVVLLSHARERDWKVIAYQFAHELCHVMIDSATWRRDRFAWLEESICEAASLFALRAMAKVWAVKPPYANWCDYSTTLTEFARERITRPQHMRLDGSMSEWLPGKVPELESVWPPDERSREYNTIIAKELLPVFEADPYAWRSVRYLHRFLRTPDDTLAAFAQSWFLACPPEDRHFVEQLVQRLGFDAPLKVQSAAVTLL